MRRIYTTRRLFWLLGLVYLLHSVPSFAEGQRQVSDRPASWGPNYISTREAICNQTLNLLSPRLLTDSQLVQRITSIGNGLLPPGSLGKSQPHGFHVIYDLTPNTFSIPSGDIFVTTGLLDLLESQDELAIVLGREIAFLEDDAGWRAYRRERANDALATVSAIVLAGIVIYFQVSAAAKAAEEDPWGATSYSTPPSYTLLLNLAVGIPDWLLKMSREARLRKARPAAGVMMGREENTTNFDMFLVRSVSEGYGESAELAADRRALSLASSAGWDPKALLSLLEKLVSVAPRANLHLSSHLAKRIIQAEGEISKVQEAVGSTK